MSGFTAADWAELAGVHDSLLEPGACVVIPAAPPGQTVTQRTVACALLTQPVEGGDGGGGNAIRRTTDRTVALPYGDTVAAGDLIFWRGSLTVRIAKVDGLGTDNTGVLAHGVLVGSL